MDLDLFDFVCGKKKKEKNTMKSLKSLCMLSYLDSLETACSGFIQLALMDSPFLKSIVKSILPTLKNHLDSQHLTASDRDELLEIVMNTKR